VVSRAQALRAQGKSAADAAMEIKSQLGASAQDLAAAFRTAGYTAAETAIGLRDAYTLNAASTVSALARAGFGLPLAVKAIRAMWGGGDAEMRELTIALRESGIFSPGDIAKAISLEYSLNAAGAAKMLRSAATDYSITAEILSTNFGLGPDDVAAAMHQGGFQIEHVALALVSSFNASADQVATALLKAGAQRQAIVMTLQRTLGQNAQQIVALLAPKMSTIELIRSVRAGLGTSAADMAKLLRARGMSAASFVKEMKTAYGMTSDAALSAIAAAGFTTQEQVEAAHRGLNSGIDYAAAYLHGKKIDAAVSIQLLAQEFTASAGDAARALMTAGYKVDEIALGLKQGLSYTALQTATVLKELQLNAAQVGAALTQVFQLGVADLAQILASVGL
jgi:hypothetical protein